MRVLIVKLGALGDIVLSLPALRMLRCSLPDAHIAWLVEQRAESDFAHDIAAQY